MVVVFVVGVIDGFCIVVGIMVIIIVVFGIVGFFDVVLSCSISLVGGLENVMVIVILGWVF